MSISMRTPKIIICVILIFTIGLLALRTFYQLKQTEIVEECIESLEPGVVVKVEKKLFWSSVTCEKDAPQ